MFESYYPCYRHALSDKYFTFALNHVGEMLLQWYRDNFCLPGVGEAGQTGQDPYDVMLSKMPSGPSRLMVLPHFNGSATPWCDMDSRGAIVGLDLATTRHDIVRAIIESQTYELPINLERLVSCGIDITRLVAAGGGSRSLEWLQAKANILNRRVGTLRCKEAACLGAAILAGSGVTLFSSAKEGVERLVKLEWTFESEPDRDSQHDELYRRYQKLYPALRSMNG